MNESTVTDRLAAKLQTFYAALETDEQQLLAAVAARSDGEVSGYELEDILISSQSVLVPTLSSLGNFQIQAIESPRDLVTGQAVGRRVHKP